MKSHEAGGEFDLGVVTLGMLPRKYEQVGNELCFKKVCFARQQDGVRTVPGDDHDGSFSLVSGTRPCVHIASAVLNSDGLGPWVKV